MIKLGVNIGCFAGQKTLEEVAAFVARLGYEMVEIPVWRGMDFLDIERLSKGETVKEILETVRKHNLSISALGNHIEGMLVLGPLDERMDPWVSVKDPAERVKFGMERMKTTARAAAQLGVPVVTGFTGSHVWDKWYNMPLETTEAIYERAWDLFAERWNEILDVFRECGVRFAFEVHPVQIAYNIETAERALEALDHRPEFGFNYDPSHFVWQLIDPVIFIKRFGERIYHAHAKDGELQKDEVARSGIMAGGAWDRLDRGWRFRVPGWGDLDWRRIMTALVEVGYDYVLSYEHEETVIPTEDACEKCIQYLKPLIIKR